LERRVLVGVARALMPIDAGFLDVLGLEKQKDGLELVGRQV
jgi:hypothetical protein